MEEALLCDSLRGPHSTGVFGVHKHSKEVKVVKLNCHAVDFLEYKPAQKVFQDSDMFSAFIGHNRFATQGAINKNNAHPFQDGPITMVHNGGVHGFDTLPINKRFDVDSMTIAHNLAHHTPEEVIPKLQGSFALVWHDARDNTINFVRNDDRPLAVASLTKENTILLASEAGMLRWLAARGTTPMELAKTWSPNPYTLFTYDLNDLSADPKITKMEKWERPKPPRVTYLHGPDKKEGIYPGRKARGYAERSINEILEEKGIVPGRHYPFIFDTSPSGMDKIKPAPNKDGVMWLYGDLWVEDGSGKTIIEQATICNYPEAEFDNPKFDEGVMIVQPRIVYVESKDRGGMEEYVRCSFVRTASWAEVYDFDKEEEEDEEEGKEVKKFRGADGNYYTEKDFRKKFNQGQCGYCTADISAMVTDFLEWNNRTPICPDCQKILHAEAQGNA